MADSGSERRPARRGATAGSAASGGFGYQAVVTAYVAVHILAREPLGWLELGDPDVPYAVSAETSGPGDDLRIEFEGGTHAEVQAKAGLQAGPRLMEAVRNLARGLEADEALWGVVVVDEGASSRSVHQDLRTDLRRMAGGRSDGLYRTTEQVLAHLAEHEIAHSAVSRLRIVRVQRDQPDAADRKLARRLLAGVLEEDASAEAALVVLVRECAQMAEERRRNDRAALVRVLGRAGFRLRTSAEVATTAPAAAGSAAAAAVEAHVVRVAEGMLPSAPDDARWIPRVDEARALQREGSYAAALGVLQRLRAEIDAESASAPLRARVENNIGAALMSLDRLEEAVEAFAAATALQPEDQTYLGNLAQAQLVAGRRDDAAMTAARVLALDPESRVAWSVRIQALGDPEGAVAPDALRETPEILTARSMAARDPQQRLALLRQAFRGGDSDAELHVLLAEAIYASLFPRAEDDRPAADVVAEIDQLGAEALARARPDESRLRARALVMRGVAAEFRDEWDAAASRFREAMAAVPGYERARFAAARAELARGNPAATLYLLEDSSGMGDSSWARVFRTRALVALGRGSEIDAEVRAVLENDEGRDQAAVLHMLVETVLGAERVDLAPGVLTALAEVGEVVWAEVFSARLAAATGGDPDRYYESAVAQATGELADRVRLEWGSSLQARGEDERAIELYEAIAEPRRFLAPVAPRYARALYAVGRLGSLVPVLQEVRQRADPVPLWALDLESRVALHRDDLPGAAAALEEWIERSPETPEPRLRLASVLLRRRERGRAAIVLEPLQTRVDVSVDVAVRLARLLAGAGQADAAVRHAYRVLRTAPDDPDRQVGAVMAFVEASREASGLEREQVEPDTWVRLEPVSGKGEDIRYLILSEGPADIQRGEVLPDHPITAQLLGRRVGDTLVLHAGTAMEATYRVAELKSAEVHAFQTALLAFPERFPDRTDLQHMHVGTGDEFDPSPLFATLYQVRRTRELAVDQYKEKRLPIGVMSRSDHELRKTYLGLLADEAMPVYVESSDPNELAAALRATEADEVVVTATGLATLAELGDLNLLPQGRRLVAPRSLVDELERELVEWENALEQGSLTRMGAGEAGINVVEIAPHQLERARGQVADLLAWIEANAEVLPQPLTDLDEERDQRRDVLGGSSYDAVQLAVNRGGVLFADDWGLRNLAAAGHGVSGFSSYVFLRALAESGRLGREEFDRRLIRLHGFGHVDLPLSGTMIRMAVLDAGYQIDWTVRRLATWLSKPEVSIEAAVQLAVAALRDVALEPLGLGVLPALTTLLLERLTSDASERPLGETVAYFRLLSRAALRLLPAAGDLVEERTEAFLIARRSR